MSNFKLRYVAVGTCLMAIGIAVILMDYFKIGIIIFLFGLLSLALNFLIPYKRPLGKYWSGTANTMLYHIIIWAAVIFSLQYFIFEKDIRNLPGDIVIVSIGIIIVYLYLRFGARLFFKHTQKDSALSVTGFLGGGFVFLGVSLLVGFIIYPISFSQIILAVIFLAIGFVLIYLNYRSWKRKGGRKYHF